MKLKNREKTQKTLDFCLETYIFVSETGIAPMNQMVEKLNMRQIA
jgi:hypothetical protein